MANTQKAPQDGDTAFFIDHEGEGFPLGRHMKGENGSWISPAVQVEITPARTQEAIIKIFNSRKEKEEERWKK